MKSKIIIPLFFIVLFINTTTTSIPSQGILPPRYPTKRNATLMTMNPSQNIIYSYKITQNITNQKLFAFTREEADQFPSRVTNEAKSTTALNCTKQKLPMFTKEKIKELNYILKNAKCSRAPQQNIFKRVSNKIDIPGDGKKVLSNTAKKITTPMTRGRRSFIRPAGSKEETAGVTPNLVNLSTGNIIVNEDGSSTRMIRCFNKKSLTINGNLRLCTECQATTELPSNIFPRYINEVICKPSDNQCMTGNGQCHEGMLKMPFRKDSNNVGIDRLNEWPLHIQNIRTTCSCEIDPTQPFRIFV